jgi:hypothetical protein
VHLFRRGSRLYYGLVLLLFVAALSLFVSSVSILEKDSVMGTYLLIAMIGCVVVEVLILLIATPVGAGSKFFIVRGAGGWGGGEGSGWGEGGHRT